MRSPEGTLQSAGSLSEVPVAEGVEITSHEVYLKARTDEQQITEVNSA